MEKFLDLIETIRVEEASAARLYDGEGRSPRSLARYRPVEYATLFSEALTLVADVFEGRKPFHRFQEAMTTADFPLLFGDIIDRQVLANYQETPAVWPNFVRRGRVRDFRTVNRYAISGAEAHLDTVGEQAAYPVRALGEARYQYAVQKYGAKVGFSWEAMINDDLDALSDIPTRFGRAARRTESRFATTLYVDTNGPHASLYTAGNANIVTGNPPLSITALQTAMIVMAAMTDSDGEPITIETVELVVPPALEITATNILNAVQLVIDPNLAATNAQQQLMTTNWMRNRVRLSVDPYIPIVASAANGNTSWFLFANPNNGRPALELGFLIGHEQPEIFLKEPNARRVGGGSDPMNGDFDTDSIEYKIRHVLGGVREEPKSSVASNGSNVP